MPYVKPITDWDLKFADLAIKEIPSGFVSGIVTGERRKGKSIYVLKTTAKIYKTLEGLPDEECWKRALDCMIFGPDNLTAKVFYNVKHDIMSPVICLDDASVHFNPMLFFINPYQVSLLNGIFDTIGTVVNVLLLTCPKKVRLMKGLRNYDDITIHIIKAREGGYERIARGVLWYTMPDERQRFRKLFEDHYSCYAPDYIYIPYLELRKKYLKEVNDLFMALKNKLDETREKKKTQLFGSSQVDTMLNDTKELIAETNDEILFTEENNDQPEIPLS
jgi:hypothetical protein